MLITSGVVVISLAFINLPWRVGIQKGWDPEFNKINNRDSFEIKTYLDYYQSIDNANP